MGVALILAGHGSHVSPNTAGIVWHYVDELRRRGIADEVTACFWKEQPHFRGVLNSVLADEVVIVPVFTATGYYTQQIIPREIALDGDVTRRDGRTIHYTRTLGEHPALSDIVRSRVEDALHTNHLPPDETAVVIIGHGTRRNANTRATTQAQVAHLQHAALTAETIDAYLDDTPDIPSIYSRTTTHNIIAVPFFLAEGSHTTQDVPDALGITHGDYPASVNGRQIYYTLPVGTEDAICDLLIQLARETGHPFTANPQTATWAGFPQGGADDLRSALQTHGALTIGGLILTQTTVAPMGSTCTVELTQPAKLRQHIREEPFRSLTTGDDLPRDWVVPVESMRDVPAVVETVYPGILANWSAHQRGTFKAESAPTITTESAICERCILRPAWDGRAIALDEIPCASPCNHLLSHIKGRA